MLCLAACGGGQPPPSFTTALGIQVWVFGRAVQPQEVDAAVQDVLEEFSDRYAPEAVERALPHVRVSFLSEDTYLLEGQEVAGNTAPSGDWLYVGAGTVPLHRSAFVHEWVHALDLQLTGDTDASHASWKARVYPGIERVNARIAGRAKAASGP